MSLLWHPLVILQQRTQNSASPNICYHILSLFWEMSGWNIMDFQRPKYFSRLSHLSSRDPGMCSNLISMRSPIFKDVPAGQKPENVWLAIHTFCMCFIIPKRPKCAKCSVCVALVARGWSHSFHMFSWCSSLCITISFHTVTLSFYWTT